MTSHAIAIDHACTWTHPVPPPTGRGVHGIISSARNALVFTPELRSIAFFGARADAGRHSGLSRWSEAFRHRPASLHKNRTPESSKAVSFLGLTYGWKEARELRQRCATCFICLGRRAIWDNDVPRILFVRTEGSPRFFFNFWLPNILCQSGPSIK